MNRLTVCLIAKNEAPVLRRCLDSLSFAAVYDDWPEKRRPIWDELVVVDTGSTDDTVAIAESYGARIGRFEWCDDYAAARNYAESLVETEYVFWIDADEVLASGHEEIRRVVDAGTETSVRPKIVLSFDENGEPLHRYPDGSPQLIEFLRQDLLHRKGSHVWQYGAHEWTEGPVGRACPEIAMQEWLRPGGDPHTETRWPALRKEAAKRSERALYYLAAEHGNHGHYVEAVALLEYMLNLPGEPTPLRAKASCLRGHFLFIVGEIELAVGAYLESIKLYPVLAEPFYFLAEMYFELGQLEMAESWCRASLPYKVTDLAYDRGVYESRRYDLLREIEAKQPGVLEEREIAGVPA